MIARQIGKWPIRLLRPEDAATLKYFLPNEDDGWRVEALEESLLLTEDITDLNEDDRHFIECLCAG